MFQKVEVYFRAYVTNLKKGSALLRFHKDSIEPV